MDKIKLEILGLSSSQSEIGHFALVLEEAGGNRRLPIIIDGFQARSIALELESIKPNRPMTHDLIVSIAKAINLELVEVVITELKEGIFYAQLVFSHQGEVYEIDSRTSDAVAIGVRFNVPIYTFEEVLTEAGIEVSDVEREAELEDDAEEEEEDMALEELVDQSPSDKIRALQVKIDEAISQEDYELAASLRDEIKRLESEEN